MRGRIGAHQVDERCKTGGRARSRCQTKPPRARDTTDQKIHGTNSSKARINKRLDGYNTILYVGSPWTVCAAAEPRPSNSRLEAPPKLPSFVRVYCTSHHNAHWPGEISFPWALAPWSQPPASAAPPDCFAKLCILASSSGRKWRMRPWMGQAKASPKASNRSQSRSAWACPWYLPQMVWPSTCFVSSCSMSISRSLPWPLSNRAMICSVHLLPSRQGVHWPQLSWR